MRIDTTTIAICSILIITCSLSLPVASQSSLADPAPGRQQAVGINSKLPARVTDTTMITNKRGINEMLVQEGRVKVNSPLRVRRRRSMSLPSNYGKPTARTTRRSFPAYTLITTGPMKY